MQAEISKHFSIHLLCFWAYASCHVTCVDWPWTVNPCRQARSLFFFLKMWNLRWYSSPQPQPRFQAVGLAEHVVRQTCTQTCKTWWIKEESNLDLKRTLVLGHLCIDTLVSKREGDERERVGGKRKTRPPTTRKQVTTSKGCKLTWALLKDSDNACHLCSCVTWQAGARNGAWQTFTQHGSCFCKHKNSFRP